MLPAVLNLTNKYNHPYCQHSSRKHIPLMLCWLIVNLSIRIIWFGVPKNVAIIIINSDAEPAAKKVFHETCKEDRKDSNEDDVSIFENRIITGSKNPRKMGRRIIG